MIKSNETSDPTSCLSKAADDEPIFVLRAKDPLAPSIIESWADQASQGVHDFAKCLEAKALAIQMREYRKEHFGDDDDGLKVFAVSDCSWYIARNEADARRLFSETMGDDDVEVYSVAIELSESDLQNHVYMDGDGKQRSFRSQIDQLKSRGEWVASLFASTEF